MYVSIWVVGASNKLFINWNKIVPGKALFFVIGLFCTPLWLLTEQFCMEILRFPSYYFQLKDNTPVFWKFLFFRKFVSKLKHWKPSNFYWLSHKNLPISQTKGYFKNPYYRFLEEPMLLLLTLMWNLLGKQKPTQILPYFWIYACAVVLSVCTSIINFCRSLFIVFFFWKYAQ